MQDKQSVDRLDSEGAFTAARDKREEKLSQFTLAHEYDWVLKLIQAANGWLCERVEISQTRVATSFLFVPGEQSRFPSDSDIIDSLDRDLLKRTPVAALAMALRYLVSQIDLSFILAVRLQGELGQPIFAGEDIERMGHQTRINWSKTGRDGIRLTVSHFRSDERFGGRFLPTLSGTERRDLFIAQALKDACFTSPTPIYLDGFCITEFAHDPILGKTRYYRPFAKGVDKGRKFEAHIYPAYAGSFKAKLKTSLHGAHRFYIRTGEWWELRRFLGWDHITGNFTFPLISGEAEQHRFFWTKDGVVVGTTRLENPSLFTTLYITCCADQLRTDLTGLQLEMGPEASRLGEKLLSEIASALNRHRKTWCRRSLDSEETDASNTINSNELEAGYSLFTESIDFLGSLSQFTKSLRKVYRGALIELNFRASHLKPWAKAVHTDLGVIASGLKSSKKDFLKP